MYNNNINGYHNKIFKCYICEKIFTNNSNLVRHIKKFCKIKKLEQKINKNSNIGDYEKKEELYQNLLTQQNKRMEMQNKRIQQLEKQNKKLKGNITNNIKITNTTNNTNNNTTNNITNITNKNINIIAFGKEDMYKEYDDDVIYYLKRGYKCVLRLIENMHFNVNKPEFHSVFISNIKDLYAMIFDGNFWNIKNKTEIIDQLFDDKQFYLIDKYNQIKHKLDKKTRERFERFIGEDDEEVLKELKNDIKLLLYNKRKIPMITKRKFEKDNIIL